MLSVTCSVHSGTFFEVTMPYQSKAHYRINFVRELKFSAGVVSLPIDVLIVSEWGALKMREWKMQEWKMREHIAGVENAGATK